MEFRDTPEEAQFRAEVRTFLEAELPADVRGREATEGGITTEPLREWRRRLVKKGWIAPAWPKEYGGAGLSVMQQFIMSEELAEHRAPPAGGMGVSMVGPTLIVHGNEEQKKEHLGRILNGQSWWCQGFSEPESGSDLASLRTRAARDGDDYVLNGQKIWTSGAQYADWMFMMARTDPEAPKHKGISYFLVDMKSPGIEVRPLTNLIGGQNFSEVFFENVRTPARNLVGEENRGWYIGTTTLDFERSSIGSAIGQRQMLEDLQGYVDNHRHDGTTRVDRLPSVKYELTDRWVEVSVARLMSYRVISMQARGLIPNHEASMTKLFSSELSQRLARTGVKVLGLYGTIHGDAAPLRGRFERAYSTSLGITIAGGTSEIQRNIIAMRGLGLPRQ